MGYEVSVNLEYGFREAGERIEQRVAALAEAGLRKAEMFLTRDRDLPAIRSALTGCGVELISTVADYQTQLVDPATHEGFVSVFRKAAEDALYLGCRNIVVTSGRGVPWLKRPAQHQIFADALLRLLPVADELDVQILLESANTRHDHPGVLCSTTADSAEVAGMIGSPRVRLLYDIYHSVVEGEDPAVVLPAVMPILHHVQVADAPGRGEPGSGAIDWPEKLRLLRQLGYAGVIGVECLPARTPTSAALAYIRDLCASI